MKVTLLLLLALFATAPAWCEAEDVPPVTGTQTVSALVLRLQDATWHERIKIIDQLGLMGAQAKEALPAIRSIVERSPDSDMRYSAGNALARIGGLTELLELQASTNSGMQCASLFGLNHFAQSRIEKHRDAAYIYDRNKPTGISPPFAMDSYKSTIRNDADLQKSLSALAKGLTDKNAEISIVAAHELLNFCQNVSSPIGSRSASLENPTLALLDGHILPSIIKALSSPEPHVKRCSAEMLSRFDSIAADTKTALKAAADDSDSGVRSAATNTLKHFYEKGTANKAIDSDKK